MVTDARLRFTDARKGLLDGIAVDGVHGQVLAVGAFDDWCSVNSAAGGLSTVTETIFFEKSVRMFAGDFGRAEDGRLVHVELPVGSGKPRPGDVVTVAITQAAPFYLLADSPDGAPLQIRRTRAGDAWDRTQAESCGVPAPASTGASVTADGRRAVGLGIPTLRVGP